MQLKESQNYAKAIVDTVHNPFLVLTSNLQVKSANKSFYSEDIGNEFLILLAFTNISEVVRTNKELKQLNNHLEEFIFGASHDLQEPLRKIQTFLNMISDHGSLDEFIRRYLDKINTTADRMSALLQDMREYSTALSLNTNKMQLLDLNATVTNIIKDLEVMIQEKSAVLHIAPLPLIEGKPILMHQLFYNIIKNSLKFNNGKPVIEITADEVSLDDYPKHNLKKDRNYICIRIKDNGIGFNNKYAEKIFKMFQRLGDSHHQTGSGLGLAICKKIVEDHEGAIFAEGEVNKGATVSIILPKPGTRPKSATTAKPSTKQRAVI